MGMWRGGGIGPCPPQDSKFYIRYRTESEKSPRTTLDWPKNKGWPPPHAISKHAPATILVLLPIKEYQATISHSLRPLHNCQPTVSSMYDTVRQYSENQLGIDCVLALEPEIYTSNMIRF